MGLRDFLFGPKDEESEEIGRNWAGRVIEQSGNGPIVSNGMPEVTPELVYGLGEEYSADAKSFYNGFSEKWNEHVEEVGGDTTEEKKHWWSLW